MDKDSDPRTVHHQVSGEVARLDGMIQGIQSPEEYVRQLETPPSPPDFEITTPTLDLPFPSTGTFTLENITPLGEREVQLKNDQEPNKAAVLGVVTFESTNEHLQILRLDDGSILIGKLSPQGEFKVSRKEGNRAYQAFQTGRGNLSVSDFDTGRTAISYRDLPNATKPGGPHLLVAESTRRIDTVAENMEQERKKKVRRARRLAQSAFATFTVGLSLAPGGLADAAMDPFVHAEQVVASAELTIPQNPENAAATDTVTTMLDALDEHNYDVVKDAADAYREEHPDAFIDPEIQQAALEALTAATTLEEVEAAVKPLEAYYGYTMEVSASAPFEAGKYSIQEIIKALATIPRELREDAALSKITVGSEEEIDKPGHQRNGFYRSAVEGIFLKATTPQDELWQGVTAPIGSENGFIVQQTFIHEFVHALDYGRPGVFTPHREQVTGMGDSHSQHDVIVGGILNNPSVMSTYARDSSGENIAENMAGLLSGRRDGLTWPDQSRRFQSEANKAMIGNLIQLEREYPGIAAVILEQRFSDHLGS